MNSLELLQAYFKKETFEFKGDIKEEIARHNRQSLAPYLYYVYGEPFLKVYLGATLIQEKFYNLQNELTSLFNQNAIPHLYLKGSVLSKIYPDSTLRTRGDIDIVVREEDYEKAATILLENDYKFDGECDHHKGFFKNNLEVELHRRLCDSTDYYYDYFSEPFKHATKVSDYLYELDINYHYLFLIYHLNRHLKYGEGLRSFLDFYFIDRSYKLDYEYLFKELDKLGFLKLYHSIIACIYEITGTKLYGYQELNVKPLLDSLLYTGIHGKLNGKNVSISRGVTKHKNKLTYLLSKIFMDKEARTTLYPRMSKYYILYPFMWCHRFFHLLFHQLGKLKIVFKLDTKQAKDMVNFYNDYGILDREQKNEKD